MWRHVCFPSSRPLEGKEETIHAVPSPSTFCASLGALPRRQPVFSKLLPCGKWPLAHPLDINQRICNGSEECKNHSEKLSEYQCPLRLIPPYLFICPHLYSAIIRVDLQRLKCLLILFCALNKPLHLQIKPKHFNAYSIIPRFISHNRFILLA